MASAKVNERKVVRQVEETVKDGVTLVLTDDEAQFLVDVMSMIGGQMGTRRDHADRIIRALEGIGLKDTYPIEDVDNSIPLTSAFRNSIFFK